MVAGHTHKAPLMAPIACVKQKPVIALLLHHLDQSLAHANAILDNAQDDRAPVDLDLFNATLDSCNKIIAAIHEAHTFNR